MLSGHQTRWPNDKMLVHPTCWFAQHLSFGRALSWIGGNVAVHMRKVDNPECKYTSKYTVIETYLKFWRKKTAIIYLIHDKQ